MNRIPQNLFSLFLILLTWSAMAQPTNCITFDEPEVGIVYNANNTEPGSVIYQYEGALLEMHDFTDANNQVWFDQIRVVEESLSGPDAPTLFVNYANAVFVFNDVYSEVCFTGFLSGHEINFGINGPVGVYENLLDPAIQQDFPNNDITITSSGDEPGATVNVCISGPIDLLTIGGIEFLLDDVCTTGFPSDCSFEDPNIEAFCAADGSANVLVDFGSITGNNEFVDVYVDEELYGFYPIDAFPIVLENIMNNDPSQAGVTITVCINDIPECCYAQTLVLPTCEEESCITFNEPEVGTTFSSDTGFAPGDIVYQYPDANMIIGAFMTANGNIEFDQIQVVEGWTTLLEAPSLYINYATATFDYHIPVQEVCFAGFISGHEINFGINGQIGLFSSLLDPALPESFDGFDISITPLDPNNSGLVNVCITGVIEEFTIGGIEFLLDDVCASNPICDINNLQVGQYSCVDPSLPYQYYLNFEHNQNSLDSFALFVDNQLYGNFSYGDLPITDIVVQPSSPLIHFLVADLETDGCAEDLTVVVNDCEEACSDFTVTGVDLVCDDPTSASVLITLSTPPTNQTVSLYNSSEELIGTATYSSWNGVTFAFPNPADPDGYFLVDELTGCFTLVPPFDFSPDDCLLCEVAITSLEATDCNPNNVYSVIVDIETTAPWQQFTVTVDEDQVFGPFSIDEFPVTVGSIVGIPGETVLVEVNDLNGNCSDAESITNDCGNTCANFGATLNGVECLSPNGILVSFDLSGVEPGELILIYGSNGNLIEELIFSSNPVLVDFAPNSIDGYLLIEAPELECETDLSFTIPTDCFCFGFASEYLSVECLDNGNYLVTVELYGVEEGDVVLVSVDTDPGFTQEIEFIENPVQIEVPPSSTPWFTVFFNLAGTNCITGNDVPTPDCNPLCGEYDITEVWCEAAITTVNFVAEGPAGEVFIVQVAGQTFTFEYGENNYQIVLDDTQTVTYEFVFSQPNSNCTTTLLLDNPCYANCDERFDVVEVFCSNNGEVVVLFTAEGPAGQVFFVEVFNQVFTYEYGQNIYELVFGTIPGALVYDIVFYDEVLGCEAVIPIENPCANNCANYFAELISVDCSNGELVLLFEMGGIEVGEPLRIMTSHLPNFVQELDYDGQLVQVVLPNVSVGNFTVLIEAQGIDCETEVSVQVPTDCFPSCGEYDITGAFCGNASTLITFVAFGPEGDVFTVTVGNEIFEYEFGAEEYELIFLSDNQQSYLLEFTQPGTVCTTTLTVDNPCLDPCEDRFEILEVVCSGGNFFIVFTAEGPVGDVFTIEVLDQLFTFEYGQGTYELPLAGNPSSLVFDVIFTDPQVNCEVAFTVENPCFNNCDAFALGLASIECTNSEIFLFFEVDGIEPGEPLRITASHLPNFVQEIDYNGGLIEVIIPNTNTASFTLLIEAQGINCEQEIDIQIPEDCLPECGEQFEVVEVYCTDNGNAGFQFTAEGPAGGIFQVLVNGIDYTYEYGQTIYTLVLNNQPPNTPFNYELLFSDPVTGCTELEIVDNPCFCFINEVQVTALECNSDGTYFIEVEFFGGTSWGNGLFVVQAGGYTESFPEGFHQAILGPFTESVVDVVISEETTQLCSHLEVVEQDCTPQCEIFDLVVEGTECDPNGQYFLIVDFESNVNGPFVVFNQATGQSVEVTLDQLPIELGPYDIDEIQTSVILVYEATSNNCAADEVYVHECEPNGQCNFTNIFAEAYDCDDGQFLVDIEFTNNGGGPLGFYIFGDGMIFGPYQYGEPFYTFGPLDGSEEEHDILLLDIADPACFGSYTLDYLCGDECNITEVIAEVTECDGEVFGVELDVVGNNLGEQFIVVGNGNVYGTYNYADLPIFLGPFEGDDETVYEFGVIDLMNPTCTNFTEVGPVNCLPCDIRDLTYEVDCADEVYVLTVDFIYENPESDGFRLFVGNEEVGSFPYDQLPLSLELPYSVDGNSIRVEDFLDESCGQTIDFEIPCCTLGNILNEFEVGECQANGEYYFIVNEFNGGNLSDSLVINYAPAGSSIIATEVVAYSSLPVEIGPLNGDGATSYLVVLADQDNSCGVTTTIEPIYCDNNDCVEFEEAEGVYGPLFGHPPGTVIAEENGVAISYEAGQFPGCNTCNLFITDGIPNINFGSGLIAITQSSGIGFGFDNVSSLFNTVNIDFYYPGGEFGISVNGNAPVIVGDLEDLPLNIAPGVELQVTFMPVDDGYVGMLTFSGDNIESIIMFSDQNAAYDNVCLSLDDNVWPGDTNSDNVASHVDLLSIGLTYGFTGPARMNTAASWNGFISPNWGGEFADGLNHKHADANGDGVVDIEDEEVLALNYGLTHGPVAPFEALPYTDLDPPVYLDVDGLDEFAAGTSVQIPVVAGTPDLMINDIYGMAFTLELDPELFDMTSLEVIYPTSWFGEPDINTTHLHRAYPDGRVEVALTRTDHNNVSGFGTIMYLRIIIDDIAGVHEVPTTLVVNDIMGIDHEELPLILRPGISEALITSTKEGMDRDELISTFGIFPNPTQDVVFFKNAYNMAPNRLDLFTAAGQHLTTVKEPGMQFDLSGYPAGVYMLQIHLEGQIFTERLVKME